MYVNLCIKSPWGAPLYVNSCRKSLWGAPLHVNLHTSVGILGGSRASAIGLLLSIGLAKYVYRDNCQSNLHTGTGILLDAAHIYDELAPLTNQTNKQALGSSALLVFGFYSREGVYRYLLMDFAVKNPARIWESDHNQSALFAG